ncbi:uncharacterized protein B0J16DRAFT_359236 [Fusarium flagelliforme]|uniref:Subtilisin-like serine protease n=1 Tax=Fusarium flagelliforme TaxID=2675880 RepID=A0A395MC26_9HYPO|nr:uncharacterized protein B0J16DRAFT_359236 [Fusarium flagelliforme]KAH7196374.1 hypothetical protein B0J16DRAFT_359236 [Fusarium flagelliforme]RFN45444.1 subtilisin-like serine protease [Fusarium flagelliforme]
MVDRESATKFTFTSKDDLFPTGAIIPGSPLIPLNDRSGAQKFLEAELSTMRLKRVYKLLFLTSRRDNISPLHHQQLLGRAICVSERPDLHLVWHYDRIFVKPIPKCLFSATLWEKHLLPDRLSDSDDTSTLLLEALGFLRTYTRLIRHECDLDIAKDRKLVPDLVTWEAWCGFIQQFTFLKDREVADRYHYGEIRLTRLNLWHSLRYGRSYFEVNYNYATFFGGFGAPYLFIFGAITVCLTALQTGLATYPRWGVYQELSSSIVPFTLILTLVGLMLFPAIFVFYQLKELFFFCFAYQHLS